MKQNQVKYILFSSLFLCALFFYSQNSAIDSLTRLVKTAQEDTNKLKTLVELSKQHRELNNHTQALHYAQEAQRLAEKLLTTSATAQEIYILKKNMAFAFQITGNIFVDQGNFADALIFSSKALTIRQEIQDK